MHLKGENDPVSGALCRSHLEPTPQSECDNAALETPSSQNFAETFPMEEDVPTWMFPVLFQRLHEEQMKDKELKKRFQLNTEDCSINAFLKDSQMERQLMTCQGKLNDLCQRTEKGTAQNSEAGKLKSEQAETVTQETLCADLTRPYAVKQQHKQKPTQL